jgi:ABC-type multidrug transport system ATPase subunit
VIGTYQDADPGRTVFVSTHLIGEFEGLIDRFTIIDGGRDILTLDADAARERYQRIYARFPDEPRGLDLTAAHVIRREGREIEFVARGNSLELLERVTAYSPEAVKTEALSLEDIFVSAAHRSGTAA